MLEWFVCAIDYVGTQYGDCGAVKYYPWYFNKSGESESISMKPYAHKRVFRLMIRIELCKGRTFSFFLFFFCHSRFYTGNLLTLIAAHTAWQRTYSTHIQPYTQRRCIFHDANWTRLLHTLKFKSSSYRWNFEMSNKKQIWRSDETLRSTLEGSINCVRHRLGTVLFWKD